MQRAEFVPQLAFEMRRRLQSAVLHLENVETGRKPFFRRQQQRAGLAFPGVGKSGLAVGAATGLSPRQIDDDVPEFVAIHHGHLP